MPTYIIFKYTELCTHYLGAHYKQEKYTTIEFAKFLFCRNSLMNTLRVMKINSGVIVNARAKIPLAKWRKCKDTQNRKVVRNRVFY